MSWRPWRDRRERRLTAATEWRTARRLVDDDVTALGEQLAELHVDTLADDLDDAARHHYRRALDHYEQAKHRLLEATTAPEVLAVERVVEVARYHRACVLAVRDGAALPERRAPCFFDPRHGPSVQDVTWTPPAGVAREVAVCAADARRLAAGEPAAARMVRVGDRHVAWHETGGVAAIIAAARAEATGTGATFSRGHAAEAHTRSALGGANGPAGPYGG
jgi:hypothetical protein